MRTSDAVKCLQDRLKMDKDLYYTYQSTIAVSIMSAFANSGVKIPMNTLHEVADEAAKDYLNLFIGCTPPEVKEG